MPTCTSCEGKRYIIGVRDDGRKAVERCDSCQWFGDTDPRTLTDEQAARIAQEDGVACQSEYPCHLIP